jgi:hypothetical protein
MKFILLLTIYLLSPAPLFSQESIVENKKAEIIEWTILQLIPNPVLYQDSDGKNARMQFGFKWNVTPLNISFNPNKYVSPVQSFFIYPARRFSGSVELFVQPELATASFSYANLSVFGLTAGPRIVLPVIQKGENLALSIAGKYTYRKSFDGAKNYYYGIEAGIYVIGGILGLQYTQNFNTNTKFNINLYLKYF